MNYCGTPLQFQEDGNVVTLKRDLESRIQMIDNLLELIVFTPRGRFVADSDFGFEYWNHEFSNVQYRDFNNGHTGAMANGLYNDVTKRECQESIRDSLAAYEPGLKQVDVNIELNAVETEKMRGRKVISKYEVAICVMGVLDDGLGTTCPYEKRITFLMEPTVKRGYL